MKKHVPNSGSSSLDDDGTDSNKSGGEAAAALCKADSRFLGVYWGTLEEEPEEEEAELGGEIAFSGL